MFLRNIWYMAAWSKDLTDTPIGRRILDEPVVLFRGASGHAGALLDVCPHRAVQLSLGTVSGEHIRCPYHGLEFDAAGICRRNPHVKGAPERIAAKAYPVVERYGMVWIWMGDPAHADADLILDYSWFDDRALFATCMGYLKIDGNYQLLIDNLMDLAHAEYIHPTTVGSPGAAEVQRVEVVVKDDSVAVNTLRPDLPPNAVDKVFWTKTKHVDQYLSMLWRPASNLFLDIVVTGPNWAREDGLHTPSAHILTPETERSTHYFWAFGRNFQKDSAALDVIITETVGAAFNTEDKPMIESAQRMLDATHIELVNFTKGDAGSAHVRRKLEQAIAREQNS